MHAVRTLFCVLVEILVMFQSKQAGFSFRHSMVYVDPYKKYILLNKK